MPGLRCPKHDQAAQRLFPARLQTPGSRAHALRRRHVLRNAGRLLDELRETPVPDPPRYTDDFKPVYSLSTRFWRTGAELARRRPVSFYLLLAMIVVLLLGLQIADYRDNPKMFVLILSSFFVFFFAVMVYAILEAGQIIRGSIKEEHELYRSTLGDEKFISELSERVRKNRET